MSAVKNGITATGKAAAMQACVTFEMRRRRRFALRPQRAVLSSVYVDPCSSGFLSASGG